MDAEAERWSSTAETYALPALATLVHEDTRRAHRFGGGYDV
jgi:hypothetical protein